MKNTFKKTALSAFVLFGIMMTACEREEDPFVDRVQSPVLVVVEGSAGYLAGGGLYYDPVVTFKIDSTNFQDPIALAASIYELNKSGLLNNSVGIDSLPINNLSVSFSIRNGAKLSDLTTNSEGRASTVTTWAALGLDMSKIAEKVKAKGAYSETISMSWSGQYKGQPFVRYSKVKLDKPEYK